MINENDNSWKYALRLMARLSAWIGFPVIIAAFLGEYFDRRQGTAPWLTLIFIGVSFIISMGGLVKTAQEEFRKIEKEGKKPAASKPLEINREADSQKKEK